MADLTNIRLTDLGRAALGLETATVTGTVNFSSREVSENLRYLVQAFLLDRDDSRDIWNMLPDGTITRHEIGNPDDFIGKLGSVSIKPDGQPSRTFSIEREFDFGRNEVGREEYFAIVTVVPEIRGDLRRSNEVSIDLGSNRGSLGAP